MKQTCTYCDRCGKPFEYSQTMWAGILKGLKPRRVKLRSLFYGNMSGYDYSDRDYELCGDCTKAMEEFMKGDKDDK